VVSSGEAHRSDERGQPTLVGSGESLPESLPEDLPGLPPEEIPDWVGRFVVTRVLGRGGQSVVVSAYDPELERKVAIKLVGGTSAADTGRQRMQREAQALAKVQHPNVIAVYDVGEIDGGLYIAMEQVDGSNLAEWLAVDRTLSLTLARFIDAGRGLAAAHQAGLVHRDFKPENVLIGDDQRVRVVDFGLARRDAIVVPQGALSGDSWVLEQNITHDGAVVGTPAYLAPEQIAHDTLDARCDQFAYCVSLWEAVSGARPFPTNNLGDRYKAIRKSVVIDGERGVPGWLRRALMRGMSPRPADRFPDMPALLEVLERTPVRRRRWAYAAAGVALLSAVSAIAARGAALNDEACEDGRAQIDEAFGDDEREAMRASMLATGLAMAPEVASRVERRLDETAERWAEVHRETCRATLVRKERSQDSFDETLSCLADIRRQVVRRVEILRDADTAVTRHALDLLDTIVPPDRCANADTLTRRRALEPSAEIRDRVHDLEQEVDRLVIEQLRRPKTESVAAWTDLLQEVERVGYDPLLARVLTHRGHVLRFTSEQARAEEDFALAFATAVAAGDIQRAQELAVVIAYGFDRAGKRAEVARWLGLAQTLAKRAAMSPSRNAELERTRAELLIMTPDPARAVTMLESTAATLRAVPADRDRQRVLARIEMTLARAYASTSDYEASVRAGERAEQLLYDLVGGTGARYADAMGYRANGLLGLQRGAEALEVLREAERIHVDAGAVGTEFDRAMDGLLVTRALWLAGQTEAAVREAENTRALAKTAGVAHLWANAVGTQCRALEAAGRLDEAERICTESLGLAREQGHLPKALPFALTRLGRVLVRRGETERAIAHLEEAWRLVHNDPALTGEPQGFAALALAWALMQRGDDPDRARTLAQVAFRELDVRSHGREHAELTELLAEHGISVDL